jgi:hypothetical protein
MNRIEQQAMPIQALSFYMYKAYIQYRGGSRGGHPARAPPKIEKNMICLRKIVIFHTKYPKNFPRPPKIGKNMIFFA